MCRKKKRTIEWSNEQTRRTIDTKITICEEWDGGKIDDNYLQLERNVRDFEPKSSLYCLAEAADAVDEAFDRTSQNKKACRQLLWTVLLALFTCWWSISFRLKSNLSDIFFYVFQSLFSPLIGLNFLSWFCNFVISYFFFFSFFFSPTFTTAEELEEFRSFSLLHNSLHFELSRLCW